MGALIVAEAGAEIVGVLSASWQRALHVPGRYATIQDLWVDGEMAQPRGRRRPRRRACGPVWETGGGADRGRSPAGELRRDRRHRGLLSRQRVRASRAPDAEVAGVSELLMVEQRRGDGDAAPWIREGGRTVPGHDSNLRLDELRAGLARHERVRAIGADAGDEELERTLAAMHEAGYLDALRGVDSAEPVVMPDFAPPGLEPDIPVDAGLVSRRPRGRAHGDHRRRAARLRRPLHLRRLPSPRPPRRPRLPRRLLLPQQRRGGGANALRGGCEAGRDPRSRPPLPERDRGASRPHRGGDPALAARLAGHERRRRHRAAERAERTGRRLQRQPRRRCLPRRGRRLDRASSRRAPPPSSSRSATTPSPATRTAPGTSPRRSLPTSAVCWRDRACRSA